MENIILILKRIKKKIMTYIYKPDILVSPELGMIRLGTRYGGWVFKGNNIGGGHVISCGLGEDASFDVEIANLFGVSVVIVDPTPRAISHFEKINERIGLSSEASYVHGGKQPPESYNLIDVQDGQICLEPRAIWIENTVVRLFKPGNPENVSHSMVFSSTRSDDFIEVSSVTINEIINNNNIKSISILKMDIEGAEVDILNSINSWNLIPDQILVEFDILSDPGKKTKKMVEDVDLLLRSHDFRCINIEGFNYTYVKL